MSTPASELGSIGSAGNTVAPTTTTTPPTATANPSSWISGLFSNAITSAFSGSSFLPNAGLVIVGVVLIVGALLISQKQTVIQMAPTAEALVG